MTLARRAERPVVVAAEVRLFEAEGHPLGRIVEIWQRRVEAGDAAQVAVLLARIAAGQEELRGAKVIAGAQIGVAGRDRAALLLRTARIVPDALSRRVPLAEPALAVAHLDAFGDAVAFVEVGAAKLGDIHDARGKVIGPALVAGKVTEHRHRASSPGALWLCNGEAVAPCSA